MEPVQLRPHISTTLILILVYLSLFLDNILLTVVVPIIPDFLYSLENFGNNTSVLNNRTINEQINDENVPVSLLLSSKAVVQLVMNPVIGVMSERTGYYLPLFTGTTTMLVATFLFAYGKSYSSLFIARSLHGLASACIGVAGMCLIAQNFTNEKRRSKVMGIILGSIAMGVLFGYPFGGLFYDFVGKTTPFIVIGVLILIDIVMQLFFLNLEPTPQANVLPTSWKRLLSDKLVMISAGAIWLSSSAMAIMEPCLPLWLMTTIKPAKWQLGTVFIPDSLGYLLGTNFFGTVAYRYGHWKVAITAMILEAVAAIMVPTASGMVELVLPHFCLGLAIGIVDAALVPLLATLVDTRHGASYGCVYALQQTAVSLAYSLGPIIGGELVPSIGFPWLLRSIGILNLLYCPLLLFFARGGFNVRRNQQQSNVNVQMNPSAVELEVSTSRYDRFHEAECEYDSIGPYLSVYYCPCHKCTPTRDSAV